MVQRDSVSQEVVKKKIADGNARFHLPVKRENVTILVVKNSEYVDFVKNWLQGLLLLDKTFRVKLLTEDEEPLTALRKIASFISKIRK